MVKLLFSVHTITEAKQSNRQSGARAVDLLARSFDLARPGVAPPLSRTIGHLCYHSPRRTCNLTRILLRRQCCRHNGRREAVDSTRWEQLEKFAHQTELWCVGRTDCQ